mmetsp:Transcript_5377/g.11120  ORF Transcript_5377/g.11120 Transcript_5377/m.11120 type:complete len:88 (-) Transcript_5377:144-407(-)
MVGGLANRFPVSMKSRTVATDHTSTACPSNGICLKISGDICGLVCFEVQEWLESWALIELMQKTLWGPTSHQFATRILLFDQIPLTG